MNNDNPTILAAAKILASMAWEEIKQRNGKQFYYTLNQAAGILGLSPENTRRLAERHNVLANLGPRAKRISAEGIDIIIAAHTTKRK